MEVKLPRKPEAGGKLFFTENGITVVRNFSHLVLQSPEGYQITLKVAWVNLVTGTEERPLYVALQAVEIEKLARGYLRTKRKWHHDARSIAISIVVGWLLRGVWRVFF